MPPELLPIVCGVTGASVGALGGGWVRRLAGARVPGAEDSRMVGTLPLAAATGAAWLALALGVGPAWALPAYLYLAAAGVALAAIDLVTHRLPDAIIRPSYAVLAVLLGAAAIADEDGGPMLRAVAGCLALAGWYGLLRAIDRRGIGRGDVKLAGLLGMALGFAGWAQLAVGAVAAFVLGGAAALVLLTVGFADRRTAIPFGPWMVIGAGVGLVWGAGFA